MAKFYVSGITKIDETSENYDLILKLVDFTEGISDIRVKITEAELAIWTPRIGQYSDTFTISFTA